MGCSIGAVWGLCDVLLAMRKWRVVAGLEGNRVGGGGLVRDISKWVCSVSHKEGKAFVAAEEGLVGSCLSPKGDS